MYVPDVKDRKLLYYSSRDTRMSHTQLAKLVGLSKNSIGYRIDVLKHEGVIKQFTCAVDLGILNCCTFSLLLKFNEDIYEREEIIRHFRKHPFADWVVTLSGQWDIFAEFVCTDLFHYRELVTEISDHFGDTLQSYQAFFSSKTLRVEHLIKDIYADLPVEELPRKERKTKKQAIDRVDKKILHALSNDSSLPYLTIAQQLGLTIDIVRYRMKKLIEQEILIKCFPEISLSKIGYTEYLYRVKLKNVTAQQVERLKKTITLNEYVTYAFVDANTYSIVFVCAFKNSDEIDHLTRKLRKDYSEIIDNQEYLLIKEQVLFNLFPLGLIEK